MAGSVHNEIMMEAMEVNDDFSEKSGYNQTVKRDILRDSCDDVHVGSSLTRQKKGLLLLDHLEKLQIKNKDDFAEKLACPEDANLKVISIFGNTGDGKSHTLNHAFFHGKEVFSTSQSQVSCTVGIWAAYDDKNHLLILDTEGLLSTTNNSHQRKRLLMKILAISDVIIYRTRAERLHRDMFGFLGDASEAYLKHFSPELKAALQRGKLNVALCSLGPAVVIFHETQHTDTLGNRIDSDKQESKSADELLKESFADVGQLPQAFSSIKYVGTRTSNKLTDFAALFQTVMDLANDTSVRSWRGLGVIYNVLNHLNEKFNGDIEHMVPSTFPDSYFTCSTKCVSCNSRCEETMNHVVERVPHLSNNGCVYQAQFDNRYFTCKACYERGKTNSVIPKAHSSGDSSWMGIAKYAWSGYVLECSECGIIYRSRQYWYGNTDPVMTVVRTELKHVWPGEYCGFIDGSHTGRRVLDGLNSLKSTVETFGQVPTQYVKDWVSEAIAPSYWIPNSEIKECKDCRHVFEDHDTKHHCRACGQGFCYGCSQYERPVPDKGWGPGPVKVCRRCYGEEHPENTGSGVVQCEMKDASALDDALDEDIQNKDQESLTAPIVGEERRDSESLTARRVGDERGVQENLTARRVGDEISRDKESLTARRVGEVFHSSMSKLSAVIDVPRELINNAARPTYWVADTDIAKCFCCPVVFRGAIDSKHHCRACGEGVCWKCSREKRAVPSRGWDHPVRVCDKCIEEMFKK